MWGLWSQHDYQRPYKCFKIKMFPSTAALFQLQFLTTISFDLTVCVSVSFFTKRYFRHLFSLIFSWFEFGRLSLRSSVTPVLMSWLGFFIECLIPRFYYGGVKMSVSNRKPHSAFALIIRRLVLFHSPSEYLWSIGMRVDNLSSQFCCCSPVNLGFAHKNKF